jgi:tetratricopeptide (TPR) repeat protein
MRLAPVAVLIAISALGAGAQKIEISQHANRAQAAIQSNNADLAIQELKALLQIDPANVNAIASLGMVEYTKGDYAAAARQFEAALSRAPGLTNARAFLGMCEVRSGNIQHGQKLLEDSFPHITDKALRTQAGLELIRSYSVTATIGNAEPVIQALLQLDPKNPEVLYMAYRVHSELASGALHNLTEVAKDSVWVHEILAQNFMVQEQYSAAIKEYRKALALGNTLGLHYQLGEALFAEARTDANRTEAEKEFLAELGLNPVDAESICKLGEIALERSDAKKAKQLFLRALELRPRLASAHAALGRILSDEGNTRAAIEHLEAAALIRPDVKTTHYRLAKLYRVEGRTAEADRELAEFRKLSEAESGLQDSSTPGER